jgi:hypothetical protein
MFSPTNLTLGALILSLILYGSSGLALCPGTNLGLLLPLLLLLNGTAIVLII